MKKGEIEEVKINKDLRNKSKTVPLCSKGIWKLRIKIGYANLDVDHCSCFNRYHF